MLNKSPNIHDPTPRKKSKFGSGGRQSTMTEISYVDKLKFALETATQKAETSSRISITAEMSEIVEDVEEELVVEISSITQIDTKILTKHTIITKILQTDRSLKELEKKTENLIHTRVKYYLYWENMMNKIKDAKRKNCILKKKCEKLKLEVNCGVWESLRCENVELFNKGQVRSLNLQKICTDTIKSAIDSLDAESMRYARTRKKFVKDRSEKKNNLVALFVECRKGGMSDNEYYLETYGQLLKKKEEKLKAAWACKYSEMNDQIKTAIRRSVIDKENRCKKTSHCNVEQLKNVMEEYKELINKNFSNIKSLTRQLYKSLCYEKHARKLKELSEFQLISAKARIFESKEKYSEMKKFIPSGKVIRAKLTKALQKRKTLSYKHAKMSIEKEYMAARNEKATERVVHSWDEIKNLFFQGKRRCFKQIHAALESQKYQNLSLLIFAQTIENWWHLHLLKPPHEQQNEYSFPERGITVSTVLKPIPTVDYLENEYKQAIIVYDSVLRLYVQYLQLGCMHESDLGLSQKKRKIVQTYNHILNEEKRVFSLIQTDLENAGRGT